MGQITIGFSLISAVMLVFLNVSVLCAAQPDRYEEDDTGSSATVFPLLIESCASGIDDDYDIVPQKHNFHDAGDEDWILFYGVTGGLHKGWYTITVKNPEPACDAVLEIYDTENMTLIASKDNGKAGDEEFLDWHCEKDGLYYVRVKNYSPSVFGENTGYELAVYWPIGDITGISVVSGVVSDSLSTNPIDTALLRTDTGCTAVTAEYGAYLMLHPAGACTLNVNATGYIPAVKSVTLMSGDMVIADFSMQSAGESGNNTDCLAESLYSPTAPELYIMRTFREEVLRTSSAGAQLIENYHKANPFLKTVAARHPFLIKSAISLIIRSIAVVHDIPYRHADSK